MHQALRLRVLRAVFFSIVSCTALSGCLSMKSYVDPALPVVTKADLPAVERPQPAQVLFEFRTKGNPNAKATETMRPRVLSAITESGMFSSVSTTPDGMQAGVLKVVIDNVPITDNAAAKGFGTGLTFGLIGSMASDGYVCQATYTMNDRTTETVVRHAMHTTVGNHSGPEGLRPMQMQEAVNTVVDQLVLNALNNLSKQDAFEQE
ncbi:hypothetical protein [Marilutibacter maris]|uniref:Lipoprotein n=1 Tax=Marilutibacter maris TaxID=1605891 RepID=A0A2U9T4Z1_9GAMM|nr:hypothetical protein [Lysobacter maris]AWV07583.1 hypothetical protein C9I47_1894 [Lysobacter maris]